MLSSFICTLLNKPDSSHIAQNNSSKLYTSYPINKPYSLPIEHIRISSKNKLALELLIENCTLTIEDNEKIVIQEPTPEGLANFIRLVKAIR